MGRPVKLSETVDGNLKAPAANTSGTIGNTSNTGSTQIQFSANINASGGSAKSGYATAQKGSKTFKITNADGTADCLLVAAAIAGNLQCQLTATDSDGDTYYVSKITSRYVTLVPNDGVQFTSGQRALWVASGSEVSGVSVSIPMA